MFGQNARVPVAELLQKARRSLDVGEQEGDRSCGELRDEWMMPRTRGATSLGAERFKISRRRQSRAA